ncbi:MAG TPA: YlcI/YnfO family protein [Methylophilaceae bacterium]|nr:YlcI/YnfO family protein [Methylophilaceae bacterium]
MGTTSNFALRLPASLKQSVEQVARDDGTSLNQFVVTAIAEKLAAIKTADYFQERAKRGNLDAALALLNRTGGEPPQEGDEIL